MITKRRDIFKRKSDSLMCAVAKTNEIITIVKWLSGPDINKYSSFTNGTFLNDFDFVERPKRKNAIEKFPSAGRAYKLRKDGLSVMDIYNYFKSKLKSYPDYRDRISIMAGYHRTYIPVMFDNKIMFLLSRSNQCLDIRCNRKALSPKMFGRKFDMVLNSYKYKTLKVRFKVADLTQYDRDTINGIINDSIYYYQKEDPEKPNNKFY